MRVTTMLKKTPNVTRSPQLTPYITLRQRSLLKIHKLARSHFPLKAERSAHWCSGPPLPRRVVWLSGLWASSLTRTVHSASRLANNQAAGFMCKRNINESQVTLSWLSCWNYFIWIVCYFKRQKLSFSLLREGLCLSVSAAGPPKLGFSSPFCCFFYQAEG